MQEQTNPSMEQDLDFDTLWAETFDGITEAPETKGPERTAEEEPAVQEQIGTGDLPSQPSEQAAQQEEPPTDAQQPSGKPTEEQQPSPGKPTEERTLKVRYNGQERELTEAETISFAQKGLNYDHVAQELEQLRQFRNGAGMQWLETVAKQGGMTLEQYLAQAQAVAEKQERERLSEQGLSEADADLVVKTKREAAALAQQRAELETFRQQQQAQETRRAAYVRFFETHPEIKPSEVPKEVIAAAAKGEDLESAYSRHLNQQLRSEVEQLRQQLAQAQQEKQVQAQAVGSAATDGAPTASVDEGWAAFMNGAQF